MSLRALFYPRSIAFVGASHTELKLGGVILKNLLRFRGPVYPVNPKYGELMGAKAYGRIHDLPEQVDLGIILRPAPEIPGLIREFAGRARFVIVMSSGFAEVGEEELQEEVKKSGREAKVRLLGPNCMGILNLHKSLDTFFLPHERLPRPKRGNVAVVSQSGAILSCVLGALREANAGASKVVGYGNAVDIDETDIFDYLAGDRRTEVVISYIESVGNGRRFIEQAKILSAKKSLLVLKSGKGPGGQAAAFSHTGRLAGRYEVFHSIMRQFAIPEAMDFDELIDSTKALAYQRPARGDRVCIITNGGGSGVLAADECMRKGLEVPQIPEGRKEALKGIFPHFYGINNPVDLTAQVKDEDYASALDMLKDDYDGFLVIALPNVFGITPGLARALEHSKSVINKPLVAYIAQGGISKKLIALTQKAKIPAYQSPERAVRALKSLLSR